MKIQQFSASILIVLFVFLGACTAPEVKPSANTSVPTVVVAAPPTQTSIPDSLALAPGAGVDGFGTIADYTIAPFWDIADSGFGSLWLPHHNHPLHRISRVDLETGEVLAVIQVDGNGSGSSREGRLFTAAAINSGVHAGSVPGQTRISPVQAVSREDQRLHARSPQPGQVKRDCL